MRCSESAADESARKVFAQMDKNSDGKIHCGEFAAWPQEVHLGICVIRVGRSIQSGCVTDEGVP